MDSENSSGASAGPVGGGKSGKRNRIRTLDVILLGLACWFQPLAVVAAHPEAVKSFGRLAILAIVPWLLSVGVCWALVRRGRHPLPVVHTAFLTLVFAFTGARVVRFFGFGQGALLLVSTCTVMAWLFWRLKESVLLRALIVGFGVYLAAGPLVGGIQEFTQRRESVLSIPDALEVNFSTTPDVFVVIADSYPGLKAWEMDFPEMEYPLAEDLTHRGFALPTSAWASYAWTHMSLPSLFQMDYPLLDGLGGHRMVRELHEIIGGANRVLAAFEDAGYETYMIEAGWSGSTCGIQYDHCVVDHFVDEAVFVTLDESIFAPLVERMYGHSSTTGVRRSADWLIEHVEELSRDSEPSFVFAHLLAPHPPFFLDSDCEVARAGHSQRRGVYFNDGEVPTEMRRAFFSEQRNCVDRILVGIADLIDPSDVVLFLSDHGPDSRNQLIVGYPWDLEATIERMSVLAAFRTPGCDMGDQIVLPNVFRRLFTCLGGQPIEDIPIRMWRADMTEIGAQTIGSLVPVP